MLGLEKEHTFNPLCRKLIDVYKRFSVLPIGDTASWTGASWPWWYQSDDNVKRSWAQELELLAYEKGSREFLLQLILGDQWTMSEEQANEFLDEILDLPCHKEMKKHYK